MTNSPRPPLGTNPGAFLDSIRGNTAYQYLRTLIDVTTGIVILSTLFTSLKSPPQFSTLLALAGSIVTTFASRMFAHLVVDLADTLQWQARKMASDSDQASA